VIFMLLMSYLCHMYDIITDCDVYNVLCLMFEYVGLVNTRKQVRKKLVTLPSAFTIALGKDGFHRFLGSRFSECICLGSWQRFKLCRVPSARHMAKVRGMLSVVCQTLSKLLIFAECLSVGTRQSRR